MNNDELLNATLKLDSSIVREEKANCLAIKVPAESFSAVMSKIRNNPELNFNLLLSHTAVHWNINNEFELLYRLYSVKHKHHLFITLRVSDNNPVADSVSNLWRIAEWQEREVYDLFGIRYRGHPDLRRLFLEDDWQGFPLRKDYKDDFMLEGP